MVRPTKPKEIKPKADVAAEEGAKPKGDAGAGLGGMKLIAVNTVITLVICGLFIAANYFIIQTTVMPAVTKAISGQAGGGEEAAAEGGEEGDVEAKGVILDLGEFILNLSDPKERRYLKVNVALELTQTEHDALEAKGGGGGHGGGEAADPIQLFAQAMKPNMPPIRDAIISTLSSKTAEELSSTAGKELAKEQIKEAIDAIFNGEREVLRVSFGNFIIQ